eukprot:gnl/TRDRNA2_/TRDRNA2_78188_c1_seq1.p1 gnl/TRDRNA2_/TRDRNA2_78188_c1~~gnl/TRDRNA2_/TRDRNA2_78188_c1_seq1.p1  ORF type:complete len:256 (+),score=28.21 gnl/TRDRNA2_/TRDRNA2_78188_c1_seq1:27-770(+)
MVDILNSPPGSVNQFRHRDTQMPGPFASCHVHMPLTAMTPENGPIGVVPGSHLALKPNVEVMICPPRGSVMLYDSFVEHRGTQNSTDKTRIALNVVFYAKHVMSGYWPYVFGRGAWPHSMAYKRYISSQMRHLWPQGRGKLDAEDGRCPASDLCFYFASGCGWVDQFLFLADGSVLRRARDAGKWRLLPSPKPMQLELEIDWGDADGGFLEQLTSYDAGRSFAAASGGGDGILRLQQVGDVPLDKVK